MKALLLFDIDGTLLDTEGAGLQALREGFFQAFPECSDRAFPKLDLGGATDGSVVAFLFDHFGLENHSANESSFYRHYTAALEKKLGEFRTQGKGRVLPGVCELLAALQSNHDEFVLALLTGNAETGARLKLRQFSIDQHFTFGAYGCDHPDRNQLGPIAIDRAKQSTGRSFAPNQVIVIGDTPKDIACARACGAKVLAVATGAVNHENLKQAQPDGLLHDFSEIDKALSAIRALIPEFADQ